MKMQRFIKLMKDWAAIIWRCTGLAIAIGLILGMGSSFMLEASHHLSTVEIGLIAGAFLWIASLFVAIYLTESLMKRRIKKYLSAEAKRHDIHRKKIAANHNAPYGGVQPFESSY